MQSGTQFEGNGAAVARAPAPAASTPRSTPGSNGGFVLLALLFGASAILVMLARSLPRDAMRAQRTREEVLIYRGEQYKRAIQLYFRAHKKYPEDLDDLEDTDGVRYLRRRYKDPLTGEDEWRVIHMGPQGRFTDSLLYDTEDLEEQGGFGQTAGNFGRNTGGASGQSGFGSSGGGSSFGSNSRSSFGSNGGSRSSSGFGSRNSGGFGSRSSSGFGSRNSNRSQSRQSSNRQTAYTQALDPYGQPIQNRALNRRESAAPDNPFQAAQGGGGIPGLDATGGVAPADPNQPVQLGPDGQPLPNPNQDYSQTRPTQVPLQAGQRPPPNPNVAGGFGGLQAYQQQYGGASQNPGGQLLPGGAQPVPPTGGPGSQPGVGNQAANIIQRLLTTPRPGGLAGITGAGAQGMQAGTGLAQFTEGIAGVASTYEGAGVKVYKGYEQYQEWEFVFDYREDATTGGMTAGLGIGMPGTMNPGQPGVGPSGVLSGNPGGQLGGLGAGGGGFSPGTPSPARSRAGQQQRPGGLQPYPVQPYPGQPYPTYPPGGSPVAGQTARTPNLPPTGSAGPQPTAGAFGVVPARPASPYGGLAGQQPQPNQPQQPSGPGRSLAPSRFGNIRNPNTQSR